MSCDSVRAALIEGTRIDGPTRAHAASCPACAPLLLGPRRVALASPRPSMASLRARTVRRTISIAAVAIVGLAGAAWVATPPPPQELFPDQFADASLRLTAPLLDDPFASVDPLAGFDDPTDLLADAIPGKGSL